MKSSRGRAAHSFTLVTPANHYPSRLPPFGDAPVVKLVTPRFAPARIGEYLLALPAGGGTTEPVAPGFETFLYALDGDATASSGGDELALARGRFRLHPGGGVVHARRGRRAGAAPDAQAPLRAVARPRRPRAAGRAPRRRAVRRHPGAGLPPPGAAAHGRPRVRLQHEPARVRPRRRARQHRGPRRGARALHDRGRRALLPRRRAARGRARRLHLHGAVLPAGLHRDGRRAGRVPALQGRLEGRVEAAR